MSKRKKFDRKLYEAQATPERNGFTHLVIQRRDGKPIVAEWDVLYEIKNEMVGKDRYAVEVYPDSRTLVNECNLRHLWVFPEGERVPLGPRWE